MTFEYWNKIYYNKTDAKWVCNLYCMTLLTHERNVFTFCFQRYALFSFCLILLEPEVISFCHQHRDRFYTVGWPTSSSHSIPQNGNGQIQKWKVDYYIYEIQQVKIQTDFSIFFISPNFLSFRLTLKNSQIYLYLSYLNLHIPFGSSA